MWLRTSYYGADEFFEIQGEEGFLWVTRATGEMLDLAPVVLYSGRDKDITTTEFNDLDSSFLTGFKRSSAHFIDALLNGTTASLTPRRRQVLQLCFAVYLAARRTKRSIPLMTGSVTPTGWRTGSQGASEDKNPTSSRRPRRCG